MRQQGQTRSGTFATRAEAKQWALAVERNLRRQPVAAKAVTLGERLERDRQEVLPRKKTRTQTNQGQHMAWWTQMLGARPVVDLTPALLATCRD